MDSDALMDSLADLADQCDTEAEFVDALMDRGLDEEEAQALMGLIRESAS